MNLEFDLSHLSIAFELALLTTCARRGTGCVLVDENGIILSTGYNGVGRGQKNCRIENCPGATAASGTNLSSCEAIHSEENALMYCSDVQKIHTVYCTTSPCLDRCLRKFFNTGAKRIVFANQYPDPKNLGKTTWESSKDGRTWEHVKLYTRLWLPHTENEPLPHGLYRKRTDGHPWHGDIVSIDNKTNVCNNTLYQMIAAPFFDRLQSF